MGEIVDLTINIGKELHVTEEKVIQLDVDQAVWLATFLRYHPDVVSCWTQSKGTKMFVIVHLDDGSGVTGPFDSEIEANYYCRAVYSRSLEDMVEDGDVMLEELKAPSAEENEMIEQMLANVGA